jgi:hypothetical protein
MRRALTLALAAAVLAGCGVAAASTVRQRSSRTAATVTLTVPSAHVSKARTLTVPQPRAAASAGVQAALDDPSQVPKVADPRARRVLRAELRALDAFLAARKPLQPYREHLWYVAHHVQPPLTPRRLAALLWCTVWFPHACD